MAGELTIPLLPCRSEDWEPHFFGLDDFDPEASSGSCVVQVPDVTDASATERGGARLPGRVGQRMGGFTRAEEVPAELRAIPLTEDEREQVADIL